MGVHLRRGVGLLPATSLVVGGTVGVGIFLTPAGMAKGLASPALMLAVWLVTGFAALCGAVCIGELAARFPEAGGGYVYLREAFGPGVAFLYGWKCLLVMDPGLTAALATGAGAYAAAAFPGLSPVAVALSAIALGAAANAAGVRRAARIGHLLAIVKLALLLLVVGWVFLSGAGEPSRLLPFAARQASAPPLVPALAAAMVAAFFSFGGWWEAAKLAGEVRDPVRVLPTALTLGVAAVTITYIAVSAAFLALVPIESISSPETFVAQVGFVLLGKAGGRALSMLVAVFVIGSLFAFMTFAPRVYLAMARDGAAPAFVGAIDSRTGVPLRAVAIQTVLAGVLVVVGSFETIVSYFVFATMGFLALTVAGLFRLPRPAAPGRYRIRAWPVPPLVFLVLLLPTMALVAAGSPRQAALGSLVVLAGIPVYRLLLARPQQPALAAPRSETENS